MIDAGENFPAQSLFMGIWCIGLSAFCYFVQRRLAQELQPMPVTP